MSAESVHLEPSQPPQAATLALQNIHHHYGDQTVLCGIDLEVHAGEVLCLLGASGSGKSTLLRIVAGLEALQVGTIAFAGATLAQPGQEPPPEARQFGMVFQDHVLFPHLSVGANVGFGLTAAARSAEYIEGLLAQVGLAGFAERYPHTLSGGQQQRVALARALAPKPRVVLLDEPFASVDSTLRRQLREDTRRALHASGAPSIVVTHDAEEAMELADRIAVIEAGQVVQVGTPDEIWRAPVAQFVAELFGATDAIPGQVADGAVNTAFGKCPSTFNMAPAQPVALIARPGALQVQPAEHSPVTISDIRFIGHAYLLMLSAGDQRLRVHVQNRDPFQVGQAVSVTFAPEQTFCFPAGTTSN